MTESSKVLVRITVNLIRNAEAALAQAAEREALSRTDIVNRALQLYGMISFETKTQGKRLVLLDADGTAETIRLL